jgi:hypothetical protein
VIEEFCDDDAGFLTWIDTHPEGYVLNIQRGLNPGDARIHRAACGTLTAAHRQGWRLTGAYIKVCAAAAEALEAWVQSQTGGAVRRCGTCLPARDPHPAGVPKSVRGGLAEVDEGAGGAEGYRVETRLGAAEVIMSGPRSIPFEHLTPAQSRARSQLRDALRALEASPGQVLQATYQGPKPPNADVENLLCYNIDAGGSAFLPNCRHGLRFELVPELSGTPQPGDPSGCVYRYRLVDRTAEPFHWRRAEKLAAFSRAALGWFPDRHRVAQTWSAVHQARADVSATPIDPEQPFGVFLTLTAPSEPRARLRPGLVKSLVDGTVAAFQAQRDHDAVGPPAHRLAAQLDLEPGSVAELLLDPSRAVLGMLDQLVRARGDGVHWHPGDHLSVVGQMHRAEADADGWSLAGEVWSLTPARLTVADEEPGPGASGIRARLRALRGRRRTRRR